MSLSKKHLRKNNRYIEAHQQVQEIFFDNTVEFTRGQIPKPFIG